MMLPEPMAQGPAIKITDPAELDKDRAGFTHPNLHRRIAVPGEQRQGELSPRKYDISVNGVDSYRLTTSITHDDTIFDEIP